MRKWRNGNLITLFENVDLAKSTVSFTPGFLSVWANELPFVYCQLDLASFFWGGVSLIGKRLSINTYVNGSYFRPQLYALGHFYNAFKANKLIISQELLLRS